MTTDAIHETALLAVSGWQRDAAAPPAQYEIGQWVRSLPVGKAPSFAGQIVEYICNRDYKKFYIVRDAEKRRFARTAGELEPLQ